MDKSIFETLAAIDVNGMVEKKATGKKVKNKTTNTWEDGYLSYLSWMTAWAVLKQKYPDADYKVIMFDGKPFFHDEALGYMIFTEVTINNDVKQCWLPVMDSRNNAMKNHIYEYEVIDWQDGKNVGKKKNTVDQATMFDINTTMMRCLAKNIAMHGLGAHIYTKHDLPFTWGEDGELNNLKNITTPNKSAPKKEEVKTPPKQLTLPELRSLYEVKLSLVDPKFAPEMVKILYEGKKGDLTKMQNYLAKL